MKKNMKKTISVVLCALMVFCSLAFAGSAEYDEHPSGCQCADCAGTKSGEDLTYVEPSDETTETGDVGDAVSEVIGTKLDGKEDEIYEKMSIIERFLERVREFCEMLIGFAESLSEPLKNLFG